MRFYRYSTNHIFSRVGFLILYFFWKIQIIDKRVSHDTSEKKQKNRENNHRSDSSCAFLKRKPMWIFCKASWSCILIADLWYHLIMLTFSDNSPVRFISFFFFVLLSFHPLKFKIDNIDPQFITKKDYNSENFFL